MTDAAENEAAPVTMLHVFPSFGYGGQQARFAMIANALGESFYHHVAALDDDFSARSLVSYHAPVRYWKCAGQKSPLISLSNLRRFGKLLKDTAPDVMCTYNWGSIEAALANSLGRRTPHIHFEDGFGPGENAGEQKSRRVLARRILLGGATIVVPSHQLEVAARDIWQVKDERVLRISNGVDFARFQRKSSQMRRRLAVGSVGALRPEKNFTRLIKAFSLADRLRKATLTIHGAGAERTRLVAAIEVCGVKDRVSLPGPTDAPEEAYSEFDIFAISSDTEQAPLVLMEAMAAGLPVVSTNVGDIAEMVSEENLPFLTRLGDDDAYAQALAHLLQNPDARARLGAANRRKAKEAFNAETMIARHRALYLEKAGRHE